MMSRTPYRLAIALLLAGTLAAAGCGGGSQEEPTAEAPSEDSAPVNNGPDVFDPMAADRNAGLPAPAPDFSLKTLEGAQFALADHRGEVVLLNFWATWCGPCIVEIPDLQELHETYADSGLTVVGVSVEEGEEDLVRDFVAEMAMTYPVIVDIEMADTYGGVYGLPTTFVIDKNGQIVERVIGLFPTQEMLPRLRSLMRS
ncbi:MAG TPA: TlpA disulfide reductase family protein [Rhodothermales bacterium]